MAAAHGLLIIILLGGVYPLRAEILWSDADARVVHQSGDGFDILGGKAKRDDTANDTLYFKFHVDPLSDVGTEEYFAGFQLYESNEPRVAVGNAPESWGYSAFYTSEVGPSNKLAGEFNLRSTRPEASGLGVFMPYELPRHNQERTIVFKVQYIPGEDDLVTVWLSPELGRGASDKNQPDALTTKFRANASFDQIHLRHEGGGNGWIFSDMAVATSFEDFIVQRFWQTLWFNGLVVLVLLTGVGMTVWLVEKKKYQRRILLAEQERALERERTRIAQDLHDDLGSLLTRVSLVSGLLRADKDNPKQVEVHASKLAQTSDQIVRSLEEIVWAVRPGSDTLQSLVEYISHFAQETFDGDKARCRLNWPDDLPEQYLPPEMRHNIFLVVKEALTNALKHADAKEVRVRAKATPDVLEIAVEDDGSGYDLPAATAPGKHNGLGNMSRRAEAIGGKLDVVSRRGQGTSVRLTVCFPARRK